MKNEIGRAPLYAHEGFDYEHEWDRAHPRWIVKLAWLGFLLIVLAIFVITV